jgi:hypothetical protein
MIEMRREVLWFGMEPPEEVRREFEQRNLNIRHCENIETVELATACSAVFWFGADVPQTVVSLARRHVRAMVDYKVRVDLVASDDAALGRLQSLAGEILGIAGVVARTDPPAHALAEAAARHDAGPKPRMDLKIERAHNMEPVRDADRALFQRAFAHCSSITLVELTGGRSDARVFAVHMTVATSNAGVWPQPEFAKLDRRDKIALEYSNYREYADRFIPFGLRPNIHDMIVGAERSLLVGNFVDRSESLWDLARRNLAAQAVTSLIEETLCGWRDQAYANDPVDGAVATAMAGICNPKNVNSLYPEASLRDGVTVGPNEIWEQLSALKQQYRLAPAHGDLHGENVRVRNGQAILIDLASVVRDAPLTVDLAALETWFAFQMPPECQPHEYEDLAWWTEIERLYAPSAFIHPPGPCEPTSKHCWMSTVVRQLRRMGIAAQSCGTEYQAAVAVHLLRRCQWDDGMAADRYRRTKGYVVAARLAEDLKGRSNA